MEPNIYLQREAERRLNERVKSRDLNYFEDAFSRFLHSHENIAQSSISLVVQFRLYLVDAELEVMKLEKL